MLGESIHQRLLPSLFLALTTILLVAGCSSSSDGSKLGSNRTVNVSGKVDREGSGIAGVQVKAYLTAGNDSEQSSTATDTDGIYSLAVRKSTETYLEYSATGFATLNSEFVTLDSNLGRIDVGMISVDEANKIIGTAFGGMSLTLTDKAWLAINVIDPTGTETDGATITTSPAPAGGGATRCDGSLLGGNITTAPCATERAGPMFLAYFDSNTEIAVNVRRSDNQNELTVRAPVRTGEVTFIPAVLADGNLPTAELLVQTETGGTVTSAGGLVNCAGPDNCSVQATVGANIILSATPNSDFVFEEWELCDEVISSSPNGGTCIRTILEGTQNIVRAEFDPASSSTQSTLFVTAEEGGTVTTSPDVLTCVGPNNCEAQIAVGTAVTIIATPDSGQVFDDWDGCDQITSAAPNGGECIETISDLVLNGVRAEFDPAP